MDADSPVTAKRSGLTTALNVIVSPREAFEALRDAPTWGWALLIVLVVSMIGSYLSTPAQTHAVHVTTAAALAASPNLTDAQRESQLALTDKIGGFGFLFIPVFAFITFLVQAAIMLVFNAVGGGKGTFKTLWASSVNIAIPGLALYLLVLGILMMTKSPSTFNGTADIYLTMPSLAWLVPHAGIKTIAFLYYFNPFFIWAAVLISMAMTVVARVPKIQAYLTAGAILIGGALFSMVLAR